MLRNSFSDTDNQGDLGLNCLLDTTCGQGWAIEAIFSQQAAHISLCANCVASLNMTAALSFPPFALICPF